VCPAIGRAVQRRVVASMQFGKGVLGHLEWHAPQVALEEIASHPGKR
jgi:hypothetical protein